MKNNIQKSYLAFLMSVTFAVLALGLLFTFKIAQAESYEYVRSYSSGDGRSQVQVHTRTSSDSHTHISNKVHAYSNSASSSIYSSPVSIVTTGQLTEADTDDGNGDTVPPSHLIESIEELLEVIRNIIGDR
jgi:hypothetical protein